MHYTGVIDQTTGALTGERPDGVTWQSTGSMRCIGAASAAGLAQATASQRVSVFRMSSIDGGWQDRYRYIFDRPISECPSLPMTPDHAWQHVSDFSTLEIGS